MSAVDSEGNMVALTYTLLNRFGSGVVLPQTGILMNNAVAYFDPRPGNPVSLAGGKRINSSNMCPTIATRDGAALFAVGASGANHIVPCTARSEEHTSELQSLIRISYAGFCLKKKNQVRHYSLYLTRQ